MNYEKKYLKYKKKYLIAKKLYGGNSNKVRTKLSIALEEGEQTIKNIEEKNIIEKIEKINKQKKKILESIKNYIELYEKYKEGIDKYKKHINIAMNDFNFDSKFFLTGFEKNLNTLADIYKSGVDIDINDLGDASSEFVKETMKNKIKERELDDEIIHQIEIMKNKIKESELDDEIKDQIEIILKENL